MFVRATASVVNLSPCFALKSGYKHHSSRVSVRCVRTAADSSVVESSAVSGVGSFDVEKREFLGSNVIVDDKSTRKEEKLEPLWDDGYGTQSVKDYLDLAKEIIKPDGGPPRWFCPVAVDGNDTPLPDSPVLLFLPDVCSTHIAGIYFPKCTTYVIICYDVSRCSTLKNMSTFGIGGTRFLGFHPAIYNFTFLHTHSRFLLSSCKTYIGVLLIPPLIYLNMVILFRDGWSRLGPHFAPKVS